MSLVHTAESTESPDEWWLSREDSEAIGALVRVLAGLEGSAELPPSAVTALCVGLETIRSAAREPETGGDGRYSCTASRHDSAGTSLLFRTSDPHGIELALQLDASFTLHGLFYVSEAKPDGTREHVFDFDSASGTPTLREWRAGQFVRYPVPSRVSSFWTQVPALEIKNDPLASGGASIASWQTADPAETEPEIPQLGPEPTTPLTPAPPTKIQPPQVPKAKVTAAPVQAAKAPLPRVPASSAAEAATRCAHCGASTRAAARFCPLCGAQNVSAVPSPATEEKPCVQCGCEINPRARFCKSCGAPVGQPRALQGAEPAPKFCGNCGAARRKGAKFCHACGESFLCPSSPRQ